MDGKLFISQAVVNNNIAYFETADSVVCMLTNKGSVI